MRGQQLYTTSADYVYQELRRRIVTKQLRPGQRMPEINVAVQLGVSRTPVREALRRLASEGLVAVVPNSGARLACPSYREMEDAYKLREHLETLAIGLAAERITDKRLCRLEDEIVAEQAAFAERNLEFYLEVNETFHRLIAEASGNRILAEYVRNIIARTDVFIVFYDPFYEIDKNPSVDEHRVIVDALRKRDGEEAMRLMGEHIRLSMESLRRPLEGEECYSPGYPDLEEDIDDVDDLAEGEEGATSGTNPVVAGVAELSEPISEDLSCKVLEEIIG